jgi:hypothetical protein
MASTPTQTSVPSENYDDMRFNAGKLDEFITSSSNNYKDRLGVTHLTARGLQNSVAGALLPENNLDDLSDKDASLSNLGAQSTGVAVFKSGTPAAARSAISAASSGSNGDISEITGLTTALTIAQGGTGGKTANSARSNLGIGTLGTQNASTVSITGGSISGINDLSIADGGTGASTPATARANLGAKADSGVTDASAASSGQVGEVITVTGSSVSLTSGAVASLASVSLPPGDWEVDTSATIVNSAAATSVTLGNSSAATTVDAAPLRFQLIASINAGTQSFTCPRRRYNFSSATTIYFNTAVSFASGTATATGYVFARRIR